VTGPAIAETNGGATLRVRVTPGAKRDRVVGSHGDALKIAVRQPPERGRANREVCRLVAEALDIAPRQVSVAHGSTSKDKVLRIEGLDAATLRSRVAALLVRLGES
jgi:uncharacterized protein (TIGR00251 family)